jgi:GntR family transcriptional regulator
MELRAVTRMIMPDHDHLPFCCMSIDRGAGAPPYVQLAGLLRQRIASGAITGRLPSERYIADEYEVAMGTVRKALALLRDEGLIISAAGCGSSVARREGQ